MRDWIIANTSVTAEEYDKYIKREYKEYPSDIDLSKVSDDPQKQLLWKIQYFTLFPTLYNRIKLGIKKRGTKYSISGIEFELLSNFYADSNLTTLNRYGECSTKTIELALKSKGDLVTAICTDFRGVKISHVFLIGKIDNNPVVLDYTLNTIMNMKDYYHLWDVEEIRILSNKDFKRYFSNLQEFPDSKYINLDEFLIFPEAVNEAATRK